MPFGLVNAPSTFQQLMNQVFKPYLIKFVLVFFDDTLIYSKGEKEHVGHLDSVFQLLKQHTLVAKISKCKFAIKEVEYLGHIISKKGVSIDPIKIKAIQEWPKPATVKQLRGFLGLSRYYIRFIKSYASLSQPLKALLKKNVKFRWSDELQMSFYALKKELLSTPVLALPNFNQEFIVEIDASHSGIGVVLSR